MIWKTPVIHVQKRLKTPQSLKQLSQIRGNKILQLQKYGT